MKHGMIDTSNGRRVSIRTKGTDPVSVPAARQRLHPTLSPSLVVGTLSVCFWGVVLA